MNQLSPLNLHDYRRMYFIRSVRAKSDGAVEIVETLRIEVLHDRFPISVFQRGNEAQLLHRLLLN